MRKKVPVYFLFEEESLPKSKELEIERALIESNRQRVKTPEQKAREFTELKRIEAALAKERMVEGGKEKGKANLPDLGQSGDKAAEAVGLKRRTAEKLEAVVEAADQGNAEARAALDAVNQKKKSVDAAYRVVNESPEERAARKSEKRERNQRRFEQVKRIIDLAVSALGGRSEEIQIGIDWLRTVNTLPKPPNAPPPTPKVTVPSLSRHPHQSRRA